MKKLSIKQAVILLAGVILSVLLSIGFMIQQDVERLRTLLEHNQQVLIPVIRQGYEAQINTI